MISQIEALSLLATGILLLSMGLRIYPFNKDHFGKHIADYLIKRKRYLVLIGVALIFFGIYRL